jgi:hypothetical protein
MTDRGRPRLMRRLAAGVVLAAAGLVANACLLPSQDPWCALVGIAGLVTSLFGCYLLLALTLFRRRDIPSAAASTGRATGGWWPLRGRWAWYSGEVLAGVTGTALTAICATSAGGFAPEQLDALVALQLGAWWALAGLAANHPASYRIWGFPGGGWR